MGMMKMMVDIISVFAGIVSIILAVYAIIFAKNPCTVPKYLIKS